MSKKVLFCATVISHIKAFHLPYLQWFREQGWEVHVATNGCEKLELVDKQFNVPFERSPFKSGNLRAFFNLRKIINENKYNIIHCHTPVGGVVTRLAAKPARENGTNIIYTAHGFHFYKGANFLNWLIYLPVEKYLSRYTDCLITINNEDFNCALKYKFKAENIKHVHGVGVNPSIYRPITIERKQELRARYGFDIEDFLLIYAAELNKNKNQRILIEEIMNLKASIPEIKLLLVGEGSSTQEYKILVEKLGLQDNVKFLGYREDLSDIYPMCDIAVASSIREGLGLNIIESMCCALPIVASVNRGHLELVRDFQNGFLFDLNKTQDLSRFIEKIYNLKNMKLEMGQMSLEFSSPYILENVMEEMKDIYNMF
ncbi:glycosyltransferase family 4 protein [Paenibacillus sp. FSL K6-0276]|uniref:glycosyltransferase family 4 protein n=1 Tax=Paenibacillus sp. FSL K6-0276 TaxID=2921450 RepID=UPI0030EB30D3